MDVAFAVVRWGDGRVAAYELQMRGGGRRLRMFAIDFSSAAGSIRCDGVLTGDHASSQWLDALDDNLMAQPCERGAAPHPPPPPTER